ncbi:hypothetical protein FJZ18_03465 [Candidatus Pacearchaeota archaeon]|nr:hypothetical protein [Candidatus Pacearchaeota archaeon]
MPDDSENTKKVKLWLRDHSNILALLITAFAFILHIYFLRMASGQVLWWDEAEYMSTAKHWALDLPYTLNPQRPPLFQLAAAFFIRLGLDEFIIKLLLIVVPATALVFFTYLLGKELFDKKTGLFAALASAGMWSYSFWGARFQPDFLSVSFQVFSLFFFWKMFKNPSSKFAVLGGICAALGFYFKISALLVPLAIFIFAIWKDHLEAFKKKEYWYAALAFIIALIPFMIWQYSSFGHPLEFAKSYGIEGGTAERDFGWKTLDFFTLFPKEVFFILFVIGVIGSFIYLGLRFDLILKDKDKRLDPKIFSLIVLASVAAFYIFYIQGEIEDRWVFLITPFIFFFAAQGIFSLFSLFKIHKKEAKIVLLLLLFGIYFYSQVPFATDLIKSKLPSYVPVKEAGLWVKENSSPSDSIVSASYTQMTAYSERQVHIFAPCPYVCLPYKNEEEFDQALLEKKPKYVMVSLFEGHPPWIFQQQMQKNGIQAIIMPYFNSSIAFNQQRQVIAADIKQATQRGPIEFELVFPKNQFNGVFIYEVRYS